jgi:hypothetical protein
MQTDATYPPQARQYDRCDELLPFVSGVHFLKGTLANQPQKLEL